MKSRNNGLISKALMLQTLLALQPHLSRPLDAKKGGMVAIN
jgi:hypothetical protein